MFKTLKKLMSDIHSDYEMSNFYSRKYSAESKSTKSLPKLFVTNIGFQSIAAIRCMHFARNLPLPFGGEIFSRLIRHIYGMEVHWEAKIAPGVTLVHGNGLVIGKNAKVGSECILFHNVTLGESRNSETGESGSPTLERNVHVGPGATLVGPILVGEGTKIMAGSVLSHSVPPYSLIKPAEAVVSKRQTGGGKTVGADEL